MDKFLQMITNGSGYWLGILAGIISWLLNKFVQASGVTVPTVLPQGVLTLWKACLSFVDMFMPYSTFVAVVGGLFALWLALNAIRVVWAAVALIIKIISVVAQALSSLPTAIEAGVAAVAAIFAG